MKVIALEIRWWSSVGVILEFSSALFRERARLRMTQAEAAKLCAVSTRSYNLWENDEAQPIDVAKEGALERMRKAEPKTCRQ